MPGSKLYVGNLSYSVTEEQLKQLFSKHGVIKDAVVIKDNFTDRSKGFGFVEMNTPEEAESAITALNNTEVDGRSIKVNVATPKTNDNRRGGGGGGNFRKRY